MNPGKQALGTNCPTPVSNGMSQSEGQDSPRVCSKISINHYNPRRVITELLFLGKDEPRVLVPVAHACCGQLALPASPGAGPQATFSAIFHMDSFPTASPIQTFINSTVMDSAPTTCQALIHTLGIEGGTR